MCDLLTYDEAYQLKMRTKDFPNLQRVPKTDQGKITEGSLDP